MAVNQAFAAKRIMSQESLTSLNSVFTHHPFMEVAKDGMRKLYLASGTEGLKEKANQLMSTGYQVNGMTIPKNMFRRFFVEANTLGFTHVQYTDGTGNYLLELKRLEDFEAEVAMTPDNKKPVVNRDLQAVLLIYTQEGDRYARKKDNENALNFLDTQLTNIISKSTFLLPIRMDEGETEMKKDNFTLLSVVDKAGDKWIPVCVDFMEFTAFAGNEKLRALKVLPGKSLALIGDDMKGLLLNPRGVAFKASRENLEKVFGNPDSENK